MPPTNPVEAARDEQIRQSQLDLTSGATGRPPDPRNLSGGGQSLLDLQRDLTRDMGQVYQRPEEAFQRLTQLDDAGRESLVRNPSQLGPLRDGVQPSEETMQRYVEGGKSYDMSPPEARTEVSAYNQQMQAAQAQETAQSRQNPMERQMGNALTINQSQLSI